MAGLPKEVIEYYAEHPLHIHEHHMHTGGLDMHHSSPSLITALTASMAANPAAWIVGGVVVAGLAIAYFASRDESY
jgi:hypothetical protein